MTDNLFIENVQINNKEDFLKDYDRIFPDSFRRQIEVATVEGNVEGSIIALYVKSGSIRFSKEGKIIGISYNGY